MEDTCSNENVLKRKRFKIWQQLKYTPQEVIFQDRSKRRSKRLEGIPVPFSAAAHIKFKNSCFGTFLEAYNEQQIQDKEWNKTKFDLLNWDLQSFSPVEKYLFDECNDLTDNLYELLTKAVENSECINWKFIYENLKCLRVSEYHITEIDDLKYFKNIRVLLLAGNWLENISGQNLPRKLKFLELYSNTIAELTKICEDAPKRLHHLGFGRNKLTDSSKFRTLATCGNFQVLRSLDLSDNDIYNVLAVVEPLKDLNQLKSLQLEGNPCSTCIAYKNAVLSYLPKLMYLDNTEVLAKDRTRTRYQLEDLLKAALTFTCHRIMGLKSPPKLKGIVQTLHFEVNLPLLEEIIIDEATSEEVKEEKDDGKDKKAKSTQDAKKSKNAQEPSPYEAPDEYEKEKKLNVKNNSFKTERLPWAKVYELPEEILVVESPEQNLTAIRDTFRSSVNVKVVYLEVQIPEKPKEKKDKKAPVEVVEMVEEPQETIAKKITIANFFCDLHNVNWSDKTVDFYWAQHSKCAQKAIPVDGSLRAINYVEGKEKPEKTGTGGEQAALELTRIPSKEFIPKIFTCQVGFGLKRLR